MREMIKERVKYCDSLKAISIILVVLIHILAVYRDLYLGIGHMVYYFLLSFADSFTRIAVPMFFMITGIFMLSKPPEKSYKIYLKKRLPKLIIPLIVFSIVYYIYENIEAGENLSILNFFQLLTSSGDVRYHFWFMYEIIKIYLLLPFLEIMIKNISKNALRNLIILIFIIGNFISFISGITNRLDINLFGGLSFSRTAMCINYLFLGYYLYKYPVNKKVKILIYIGAILSIIILPIADLFLVGDVRNDQFFVITSIFPILPTIAVFLLFKEHYDKWNIMQKLEPITNRLAKQSIWIYLTHVIVMELLQKYLPVPQRFLSVIILTVVLLILTVAISYILAIVLDWLYKKIFQRKVNI